MTDARAKVCCPQCSLSQFLQENCRRCGWKLPQPLVVVQVQQVDLTFGPTAPVIPLRELARRAIVHALNKSSSVTEAAQRLGIGKTTLYNMMHRFGIREGRQYAERVQADPKLPPEQNYLFLDR